MPPRAKIPLPEVRRRLRAAARLCDGLPEVMISVKVDSAADLPYLGPGRDLYRTDNAANVQIGTVCIFVQVRDQPRSDASLSHVSPRQDPAPFCDEPALPPRAEQARALPSAPPPRRPLALPPAPGQMSMSLELFAQGEDDE